MLNAAKKGSNVVVTLIRFEHPRCVPGQLIHRRLLIADTQKGLDMA